MADIDLFGWATSTDWRGLGVNLIGGIVLFVIVGAFAFYIYIWMRDKKLYKHPVTFVFLKENGGFKELHGLRGGIVQTHIGVSDFQIKAGRKRINLGYIPDLSLTDAEDTVTFLVLGDNKTIQQCKKSLLTSKDVNIKVKTPEGKIKEEVFHTSLIVEPIPTDVKTATINNIHLLESIMDKNKLTAMKISIGAFVLMVFLQILFLFLTSKK